MKKPSRLLLATSLASVLLAASCGQKKKTPLEINKEFAAHNLAINQMGRKWVDVIVTARTTKDFRPVTRSGDSIVKVIDGMIAEVDKLKDAGGSEAFRKKEVDYLHFEKDFIQHSMVPFNGMNSSTTDEEFDAALRKMLQSAQSENQHLAELARLQDEFMKRNGISLEQVSGAAK